MKNWDLIEAMSGIRPEYIDQTQRHREEDGLLSLKDRQEARRHGPLSLVKAAAILLALGIALPNTTPEVAYAVQNLPVIGIAFRAVTFRNYSFSDEAHSAEVAVPELSAVSVNVDDTAAEAQKKSLEEVNQEIQERTDALIKEFQSSLQQEGYSGLHISYETVTDSEKWYAVKLSALQTAADSALENRYYVFSKKTGVQLKLQDLFREGSDYRSVLSQQLKTQMLEAEKADSRLNYFLEDSEVPDGSFQEIREDQPFYINQEGQLVIAFDEGEIAPMSMGAQEFVVPWDTLSDILDPAVQS